MTGEQIVGTRHFGPNSQEPLLNYLYGKAFVYVSETQATHYSEIFAQGQNTLSAIQSIFSNKNLDIGKIVAPGLMGKISNITNLGTNLLQSNPYVGVAMGIAKVFGLQGDGGGKKRHQEVMKQLGVINRKLDVINGKLDQVLGKLDEVLIGIDKALKNQEIIIENQAKILEGIESIKEEMKASFKKVYENQNKIYEKLELIHFDIQDISRIVYNVLKDKIGDCRRFKNKVGVLKYPGNIKYRDFDDAYYMDKNYQLFNNCFNSCQKFLYFLENVEPVNVLFRLYSSNYKKEYEKNPQVISKIDSVVPYFNKRYYPLIKWIDNAKLTHLTFPSLTVKELKHKVKIVEKADKEYQELLEKHVTSQILINPEIVKEFVQIALDIHVLRLFSYDEHLYPENKILSPETYSDSYMKSKYRDILHYLLNPLLDLLNIAIAQQTLLCGDIILPQFTRAILSKETDSSKNTIKLSELKNLLAESPLLTQNLLAYMLNETFNPNRETNDQGQGNELLKRISYKLAFSEKENPSPPEKCLLEKYTHLEKETKGKPIEIKFLRNNSPGGGRWYVSIKGINQIYPVPELNEFISGRLILNDHVIELLKLRELVINEIAIYELEDNNNIVLKSLLLN